MNMNKQMEDLGQIGSQGYGASDDVVSHLLAKTRRTRTLRQSGTTAAAAIGAMALGMISMQAVAALRDEDPAHSKIDIVIDDTAKDDTSKYETNYTDPAKIEYLEASAQDKQEQLDKNKADWEAKKAAEAAAAAEAAKKAEEEAAKKKAEADANKKKDDGKKTDGGKKDPYVSPCGAWQVDFGGCQDTQTWTDVATGLTFRGYFSSDHGKVGVMNSNGTAVSHWLYNGVKVNLNNGSKTCTGEQKLHDGNTYQWSCVSNNWHLLAP